MANGDVRGTPGVSGKDQLSLKHNSLLLRTKLFVPPPGTSQITRLRLIDLIDGGLNCPLILVSAPAGYGKTTLVSNWLREKKIPSSWLSLDSGDNDPVRFLQYLFAALAPFTTGLEVDVPGMLQGIHPVEFKNLINRLANELVSVSSQFVLVLDDFHVIHSEEVLNLLYYLIEHLPPQIHLAILTRTDPPLPLSRLRVNNQLLDIRVDQLRFTTSEVATFLNEVKGLGLSNNDISALETRTEGWIAGLQLAALSMQGSRDIHGFVSAFTGSHHYVMDYLAEEVLKLQPKDVSTFLVETSILDRLCGSLCEVMVEEDSELTVNGQSLLESLEEMNLFVIPLDDERRWYRYHHLFADVLRKRLQHQYPQKLPELHGRASQWYEANGFIAESINHAIAAGTHDRAAQLIEEHGCFLLMSGEVATLLNWTDTIDFQSETRPWLAIQKAWALALTGDLDRIEPTLQVPEQLLSPLEPTDEVNTMRGTIAAARANCANARGDTHSAAKYARQALDLLPNCSSISKSVRSVATSIRGDASRINGDLEEAITAYTEAIKISREAKNLHMDIIANSNLAEIFMEQGKLQRSADILRQSLQLAVRPDGQRSPLAGRLLAELGKLAYEHNELNDADQYIHQCIDLSRKWGDNEVEAFAWIMLARVEFSRGNLEVAQGAMQDAERLISEHVFSPRRTIELSSEMSRCWLLLGNIEKASQLVKAKALSITDEIAYLREPEYLILLRILLVHNDISAAMNLSERLLEQVETTGRMALVIEVLILRALALQGMKETELALETLEKAFSLAQPEGYFRTFLDEGQAMTMLLCQINSRKVGSGYASVLLSGIEKTSGMTQPSLQLLIEPLTSRELEVLKLIETGCSNQDIASQLVISITTVKRHISNIYGKLGVKSRTQALAIGKELNLFE